MLKTSYTKSPGEYLRPDRPPRKPTPRAAQMEAKGLRLFPEWIPRESNQEADDLTNELFSAFDLDRRIAVSFGKSLSSR